MDNLSDMGSRWRMLMFHFHDQDELRSENESLRAEVVDLREELAAQQHGRVYQIHARVQRRQEGRG